MKKTICKLVMGVVLGSMMLTAPITPALGPFQPVMTVEAAEDNTSTEERMTEIAIEDAVEHDGINRDEIQVTYFKAGPVNAIPAYRVNLETPSYRYLYSLTREGKIYQVCIENKVTGDYDIRW